MKVGQCYTLFQNLFAVVHQRMPRETMTWMAPHSLVIDSLIDELPTHIGGVAPIEETHSCLRRDIAETASSVPRGWKNRNAEAFRVPVGASPEVPIPKPSEHCRRQLAATRSSSSTAAGDSIARSRRRFTIRVARRSTLST